MPDEPQGEPEAIVAEEPTASAPDPEASAPEPVEETPQEAEVPAEGEPEQPAAELTDEDWQAIYEKYPDRDPSRIREQVLAEAQKPPPPERAKAADPFYNEVTAQANESYARIRDAAARLVAGELDDPTTLLADIAVTGAWQAASERRGHIAVNRAVVERALGVENGQLDDGDPLHEKYGELLNSLEKAQQAAGRKRANAVREYDPQKRAAILTEAEVADANAVGNFYHQTIELAMAKGEVAGKAAAEKDFGKRAPALAEKARANGQTEAIAKARQTVLAGKAQGSAANIVAPSSAPLTVEEASTLPIDELKRRRGS